MRGYVHHQEYVLARSYIEAVKERKGHESIDPVRGETIRTGRKVREKCDSVEAITEKAPTGMPVQRYGGKGEGAGVLVYQRKNKEQQLSWHSITPPPRS